MLRQTGRDRVEVAGLEVPPPRAFAVIQRGVRVGHTGEFGSQLDGGQVAGLPHRIQQVDAHRARSGTRFEHVEAASDVAELDDLRDVLRVHDLGAARHGEHVVGETGAHDRILPAADRTGRLPRLVPVAFGMVRIDLSLALGGDGGDDHALGAAYHVVVQNDPVLGLGDATGGQLVGDLLALAVGELDLFACDDRPASRVHGISLG